MLTINKTKENEKLQVALEGRLDTTTAPQLEGELKNSFDGVKILGNGEISKALTVQVNKFSKTAAAKIEAAGGKAEVI